MKLRNGLFLRGVALYDDHVALEVFASRALLTEGIADICLTDDLGTKYEMASPESGMIEGKAEIEFRPARLLVGQDSTSVNLGGDSTLPTSPN